MPTRANVERELQRDVKVVLYAQLAVNAEAKPAVVAKQQAEVGTNAGIPVQSTADVPHPLIDTRKMEKTPVFVEVQAEIELGAVVAKAMLIGDLCACSAASAKTQTEIVAVLGKSCRAHSKNCHEDKD